MTDRKLKVMPLKNITPDPGQKPKRYVFALGQADYTSWTLANLKLGAGEEFVFVQHLDDVRELRNIVYSITPLVEQNPAYHKAVQQIISIVNFNHAEKVDEQVLPKVVQEMINESPFLNELFARLWKVGDVIKTRTTYSPINVIAYETIGVVYNVGMSGREPEIIFENGEYSGWSDKEHVDLEFICHCDVPEIENYYFTNVGKLTTDYHSGYFNAAFNKNRIKL